MQLLTKELRKQIPPLGTTSKEADPMVVCKFFTPDSNWTWYVIEFDGEDICFGLVEGNETELGYFSLSEIQAIHGPAGLRVERDLYFDPVPLSAIKKRKKGGV